MYAKERIRKSILKDTLEKEVQKVRFEFLFFSELTSLLLIFLK